MIKLLSTDFDGTLVDHDASPNVDPALFTMLWELRQQGVLWAVNTGRMLWHLDDGLAQYGFPFAPDFALVEERDVYHRGASGAWEPLGDWNARGARDHDELFALAGALLAEVLAFLERLPGSSPIHDKGRFVGAITADEEQMDRLCAFLTRLSAGLPLFSYQRNTIYVRFCHHAYSKGTALGELARVLGVPPEQVFAAGDHHNDLAMLDGRFAKYVTCPGNSCAEVKLTVRTAGGYVAESHASTGIVEAMRHFGVWG